MPRDESTSVALLGLLSIEPMSGYDMRRHVKDSLAYFWSESYGQIYPALKRLSAEGLIQTVSVRVKGTRRRQVYKLTTKGRAHLKEWLGLPPRPQQPRDEFLLKLFLGNSGPEGAIGNHLLVHLAEQERALATYRTIRDYVQRERKAYAGQKYWLLLLKRGMALRQAEIDWCNEALASLGYVRSMRR